MTIIKKIWQKINTPETKTSRTSQNLGLYEFLVNQNSHKYIITAHTVTGKIPNNDNNKNTKIKLTTRTMDMAKQQES